MTLEDLGNIGDFVSSLGVIASLLFVGLQMRTNGRLMRATAVQGAADFFTQMNLEHAKNPELSRVWELLAHASWDELSASDRLVGLNLVSATLNTCDRVHTQRQEGLIPLSYWAEVLNWMRHQFLTLPLVREYWARVVIPGGVYSSAFIEEITREIAQARERTRLAPWTTESKQPQ